jgi:GGDEF domain-containing protein
MHGKSAPMERGVPRRRRPGPVVTEGVEALLLRNEELAKGWLLALVEDAPLEAVAAIMAGDVARDGPRICDAVVRAICDEADLRRIEPGGVLEPLVSRAGELAGVGSAESDAHAVDTLRSVVWSALRVELVRDDPEVLADAGERLSFVAELVRAAVLRRRADVEGAGDPRRRVSPLRVARPDTPAPGHPERRASDQPERRGEGSAAPGLEVTEGPGAGGGAAGVGGVERGGATEAADRRADRPDEAPAQTGARGLPAGDALWIAALRDEIVRASRARSPLSLLLVELDEAERMLAVEPRREASATFGRFAQAVRAALRHRDVLACETESRAWIIARETGRTGAQALGSRIVTAVPSEESWRGAPLTVSVGVAVLGEDGHNAAALIDAAEEMRFAAEASGIGIVTGRPGGDDGESRPLDNGAPSSPNDGESPPRNDGESPAPGPGLAS